jgi:hypothetical protein
MKKNLLPILLIALAVLLMLVMFYQLETGTNLMRDDVFGVDYVDFFRPAMHADDPYAVPGFYNPFWIFALVMVSEWFGAYRLAIWVTANLCAFVYVCIRLKMPWWAVVPFLALSGAFMSVYLGNVEGLVALGLVLPSPIGIVLLMIKPQIGMAVTAHYVLSAWIYRGWKAAAIILVPALVLFSASFILYGDWFLNSLEVVGRGYNTINFFPLGLPVGIALIVAGVARRNVGYALMAIPFTAPYMIMHTWAFPFLGVVLVLVKELDFIKWVYRSNRLFRLTAAVK